MMNTKPRSNLWTAANLCTILRVLFLPLVVRSYLLERFVLSFFLIALIGLSDMLDGWIARRTNTASRLGAIMDVAADCVVIFVIQGFLLVKSDWPMYLLVLSLLSIVSFVFCVLLKGSVSKNLFGRYIGAVLLAAFMVFSLCNALHPDTWQQVGRILGIVIAAYIIMSILENLNSLQMNMPKRRSTARPPDLGSTSVRRQGNVKAVR